jgi:hypothetical protein
MAMLQRKQKLQMWVLDKKYFRNSTPQSKRVRNVGVRKLTQTYTLPTI